MKIEKHICDRCGKELVNGCFKTLKQFNLSLKPDREFEFCEQCFKTFLNFAAKENYDTIAEIVDRTIKVAIRGAKDDG